MKKIKYRNIEPGKVYLIEFKGQDWEEYKLMCISTQHNKNRDGSEFWEGRFQRIGTSIFHTINNIENDFTILGEVKEND